MSEIPSRKTEPLPTLEWVDGVQGHLRLLDQTLLPTQCRHVDCQTVEDVWEAIHMLRVRGAPAIGIAAAYGVVLGMNKLGACDGTAYLNRLKTVVDFLSTSRPTAVNLFWALERMQRVAERHLREHSCGTSGATLLSHVPDLASLMTTRLLAEAQSIEEEDRRVCREIGRYGAELLVDGQGVLTHCNAGGLATADFGTALAAFFVAQQQGKRLHVYVDETRPLLQGSRLTAWELQQRGIPATLICDSMAALVMKQRRVQAVVTGADRIAANGDTANKIGTYSLAVLARAHAIPFYVAAPLSTFDLSLHHGDQIPIEQRDRREITHGFGRATAPEGIDVYNPAFDVTPAELITAVITERGLVRPVDRRQIAELFRQP